MSLMSLDPIPTFSPITIPQLPMLSLTEAERSVISRLQLKDIRQRSEMQLRDAYYRGEQIISNLRIAIPAELEFLRTIVGWPRIAVDPLVERIAVDGFRLPTETEEDPDLEFVWTVNGLDSAQSLGFTDAFSMGRFWFTVGSGDDPRNDPPRVGVESPLNMSAAWDLRSEKPSTLLQQYWVDSTRHAALLMPDQTIHLAVDDSNDWQIVNRDQHNFGLVPAVRVANAARTNERDGHSEITNAVMSITDSACRDLLGLEVAREIYTVPRLLLLGATESDFQDAEGNVKTAWQTYMTAIIGLERDENGDLPTAQQLKVYDPSVFTTVIEMRASQMASEVAASPQDLGLYTQGNPVSADAQQIVDARRDRKARHKQRLFAPRLIETMQIVGRFMNKGEVPDAYKRMAVDWMPPEVMNLAQVTDAMGKQVAMGSVTADSDVVLRRLGYNTVERKQLKQDRDAAQTLIAEVATSVEAKELRANTTVAADLAPTEPPTPPSAAHDTSP